MRWLPLALLLALPGAAMAQAEPATASPAVGNSCGTRAPGDTRPRIGLALGGGGARGFAHVSILRKLETLGIPVDCIAGTSAGALVGALYASGKTADEIEQVILGIEWKDQFNDTLPRQQRSLRRKSDDYARLAPIGVGLHGRNNKGVTVAAGFAQGQKLLALFEEETGIARTSGSFDDLPIPFRATATDLNTGKVVVLDHGSLAMAMRASMSLPGIFRPVEIDGKVLLDGGLANNVPVDVVRAMGAERIIAVDVGTPLAPLTRDASMLEVMGQLTGFLTTGNTAQQVSALQTADVLIKPALDGKVATADFEKGALAMEVGKEAADAASGELARLAVPQAQYARFQATHRQTAVVPPTIEFIKVDNETGYADEVLMSYLPVRVGEAIDGEAMQRGILRAYGLGTISSIYYQVVEEDGKTGVAVQAYPKPHGPVYVQAGLTLSNDLQGSNDANLRAGLLFAPISPYGAEARVVLQLGSEPGLTGEYYHPFDGRRNTRPGSSAGTTPRGSTPSMTTATRSRAIGSSGSVRRPRCSGTCLIAWRWPWSWSATPAARSSTSAIRRSPTRTSRMAPRRSRRGLTPSTACISREMASMAGLAIAFPAIGWEQTLNSTSWISIPSEPRASGRTPCSWARAITRRRRVSRRCKAPIAWADAGAWPDTRPTS